MSEFVPEGWIEDVIGSYIANSVAGEWGSEADGGENDIPVLRATNFSESGAVDYQKLAVRSITEKKRLKKSLQRGDIVLEKSGGSPTQPVGRVIYFDKDQPFLYSNFTQKLSPIAGCDSKYLFYKLYFEYQNGTVLKFQQQTTGIINFQLAEYLLYKTVFPPLPEQQKIAAILSSVDEVIEKTQVQIDKLKDLKTGMMQALLTKGIGHTEFKDSPVGRIPVGWEVVPISALAVNSRNSFVIGPFGSNLVKGDYRDSGVPVVFVRDISPGSFKWVSNVFVTEKKADELASHNVNPGEIVITKMGLPPGIAAVYDTAMSPGIITADIIRLRPDLEKVNPNYLVEVLNSDQAAKQVRDRTAGQTRPKLTLADYRTIVVPLPDMKEQEHIAEALGSVRSKIDKLHDKHQTYMEIKKALMQDLLTGKVRVKV